MRCAVVINQGSGTVKELWNDELRARLEAELRHNGWSPSLFFVPGPQVAEVVRDALASGVQAVLAGGGDGTTRAVASQLCGTSVAMGVLPFGTFNLAARDLGTPLPPVEAVRSMYPGQTRRIDVLRANGELCLCMLVLGFYPLIAKQQMEYHGRNWWVKSWRFAAALWNSYFDMPELRLRLTHGDGSIRNIATRFLAAVPGEYEDTLGLVPRRENLASGHCTIYTSRHSTRWSVVRATLRYAFGAARQDPDLEITPVRRVNLEIKGERRVPAAIDGELLTLRSPIELELMPQALTVLVPSTRENPAPPALIHAAT